MRNKYEDFNEYQRQATRTATFEQVIDAMPEEKVRECLKLAYVSLGLAGEAGEVAEKVKKLIRDHKGILTPEYAAEINKEQGDVTWYGANISRLLGTMFSDVPAINIAKLAMRAARNAIHGSGDNR